MKTIGMKHQLEGLKRCESKRNFAFLMEQGTGKTWLNLADAERCYNENKIDALLVVAPKGVHTNWVKREIPLHLSCPYITYTWKGTPNSKKAKKALEDFMAPWIVSGVRRPLMIFSINIDSVNTKAGYDAIESFLETFRTMMTVDESTRIKNIKAERTKKTIKLGKLATARRILTGTPLTKSPVDLFSQFEFLKKGLIGNSLVAFTAEYSILLQANDPEMIAIMEGLRAKGVRMYGIPQVVKKDETGRPMYRNLNKLSDMIAPHSYRVRKADCLDLPPKIYKQITFELSSKQRQLYDELANDYSYLFYDEHGQPLETIAFAAIAARSKMKQITSGFINIYGEAQLMKPEDNPRMETFIETVSSIEEEGEDPQFIVWAMFTEEINQICDQLEKMGIVCAAYNGATPQVERDRIIDEFQAGRIQAFVGHAAAAGIGITLTAAEIAIYYSCSFDNELRMQSEDRNHRIGTTGSVLYIDLVAEDTLDEDVVMNLALKTRTANIVIDRQN